MLSRVADTIYWLARYMERTQAMLQVIRTNYIASQDEIYDFSWRALLQSYGDLAPEELSRIERSAPDALEHLVLDRHNGASAYNNILQGRENARAAQDHLTKEVWRSLNDYYHAIRDRTLGQQVRFEDPVSGIDQLMRNGLLFTGTVKNTMPRDEGYAYLHVGKFLERAIQTTDTLHVQWATVSSETRATHEATELRYLLYSLFGHELYTKTHKGNVDSNNVLRLILYNTGFPHSLLYSLNQLSRYYEHLQAESLPESYERVGFLIGKVRTSVRYSDLSAEQPEALADFLVQTRDELLEIAAAFSKYFFGNS